jgi:hypothetical protein
MKMKQMQTLGGNRPSCQQRLYWLIGRPECKTNISIGITINKEKADTLVARNMPANLAIKPFTSRVSISWLKCHRVHRPWPILLSNGTCRAQEALPTLRFAGDTRLFVCCKSLQDSKARPGHTYTHTYTGWGRNYFRKQGKLNGTGDIKCSAASET